MVLLLFWNASLGSKGEEPKTNTFVAEGRYGNVSLTAKVLGEVVILRTSPLDKKKRRRTLGPEGSWREWSVFSCKVPPQCAQHIGSRDRSYWPSNLGKIVKGVFLSTQNWRIVSLKAHQKISWSRQKNLYNDQNTPSQHLKQMLYHGAKPHMHQNEDIDWLTGTSLNS